ncbi:MAG: hypothetical protein WAM26_16995, partial [Nitrososphaeraceae archaeon]
RKRARFVLTSLGRIVYETHKTIGVAIQNRWKLDKYQTAHHDILDSFRLSLCNYELPKCNP